MLAATLLTFVASTTPAAAPDYRQVEITDMDRRNIALMCTTTNWSKKTRLACLKAETEKLRQQKQAQVDARDAEALTAKETAR